MGQWKKSSGGKRFWLLFGGSMLTVLLLMAAVALYGLQQSVPSGLRAGPWTIGGKSMQELDLALVQLEAGLRDQQIVLGLPDIPATQTTAGAAGLSLDASELLARLEPVLAGNPFSRAKARWNLRQQEAALRVAIDRAEIDALVQREWADIQARKPVKAERIITSHDEVRYKEGRSVKHVDEEALARSLASLGQQLLEETLAELQRQGGIRPKEPVKLSLPMREIIPPVTVESLKEEGIERRIAQFTTTFARSGEGRIHNIQATADAMQDMILKPGEIFDYAAVVERTRQNSGYREAPIILNGKLVPGIGGGICQVSTTLYNAALRSGLEIVERRNHSLPIHYVPLGQDATFSSGYINFRFRNNTGKHLQIRTVVKGRSITVKLFGTMPRNVQYQIRSKITRTIEPPVKVVRNNHLRPGEERVLQSGKVGYEVVTERIKLVDGKTVQTETISTDRYQPKPRLVARHTGATEKQPPAPAGPKRQIIEDGVSGPLFD